MPAPEISTIRVVPQRSKYSEQYAQDVEDFLTDLQPLPEQINAVTQYFQERADGVDTAQQSTAASEAAAAGYRDEAEDFKNAAAATVNFAGKWADLTGTLNAPAVVYHQGIYWNLLTNLADVTTSEPSVNNSDWLKVYEVAGQNNLTATTDPTVNDDETQGYRPTSRWINTATGEFWLCISAGPGAADWQQATLTVDELGSAALADTADFDAAGTAAAAVAAYSDEAEGLYAPITRSRKNLLINGDFRINQREAASKAQSPGVYGYDRWKGHADGIEQIVEGDGIPVGNVTLSWVGGGTGSINGTSGASPLTVSVPADTNISVVVPDTSDKVQLEIGGTATDFEYRTIGEELALCQRYYFKCDTEIFTSASLSNGALVSSETVSFSWFPTQMRATPSVALGSISKGNLVAMSADKNVLFVNISSTQTGFPRFFGFTADAEL